MNPKNKRTLFLTSTICIILSIVAFALSHMGGASNENYILLYVIAVLLNIVLNLALNIKIASTNGAKALMDYADCGSCIFDPAGIFRTVSCQDHARYLLVCFYWYFVYCQWQLFSQKPHQSLCRTKVSVAIQ